MEEVSGGVSHSDCIEEKNAWSLITIANTGTRFHRTGEVIIKLLRCESEEVKGRISLTGAAHTRTDRRDRNVTSKPFCFVLQYSL